jgi:predicted nucleic acid-binding protein
VEKGKQKLSIVPEPISIHFNDENDKVFYEVAISVRGNVVTGNKKQYPNEPSVVSPNEFLDIIEKMQL